MLHMHGCTFKDPSAQSTFLARASDHEELLAQEEIRIVYIVQKPAFFTLSYYPLSSMVYQTA